MRAGMIISGVFLVALCLLLSEIPHSYSQDTVVDIKISEQDKIIWITGFGIAVVGLFIFLARDIILRRKTSYDTQDLESKKEKTFEKYHSDWSDDYEEVGKRTSTKMDQEFRDAIDNNELPDYYDILGVEPDATQEEIKQKFRTKVKENHPDKTRQQTEEAMAELNHAYEILSDIDSRTRYDRYKSQV